MCVLYSVRVLLGASTISFVRAIPVASGHSRGYTLITVNVRPLRPFRGDFYIRGPPYFYPAISYHQEDNLLNHGDQDSLPGSPPLLGPQQESSNEFVDIEALSGDAEEVAVVHLHIQASESGSSSSDGSTSKNGDSNSETESSSGKAEQEAEEDSGDPEDNQVGDLDLEESVGEHGGGEQSGAVGGKGMGKDGGGQNGSEGECSAFAGKRNERGDDVQYGHDSETTRGLQAGVGFGGNEGSDDLRYSSYGDSSDLQSCGRFPGPEPGHSGCVGFGGAHRNEGDSVGPPVDEGFQEVEQVLQDEADGDPQEVGQQQEEEGEEDEDSIKDDDNDKEEEQQEENGEEDGNGDEDAHGGDDDDEEEEEEVFGGRHLDGGDHGGPPIDDGFQELEQLLRDEGDGDALELGQQQEKEGEEDETGDDDDDGDEEEQQEEEDGEEYENSDKDAHDDDLGEKEGFDSGLRVGEDNGVPPVDEGPQEVGQVLLDGGYGDAQEVGQQKEEEGEEDEHSGEDDDGDEEKQEEENGEAGEDGDEDAYDDDDNDYDDDEEEEEGEENEDDGGNQDGHDDGVQRGNRRGASYDDVGDGIPGAGPAGGGDGDDSGEDAHGFPSKRRKLE